MWTHLSRMTKHSHVSPQISFSLLLVLNIKEILMNPIPLIIDIYIYIYTYTYKLIKDIMFVFHIFPWTNSQHHCSETQSNPFLSRIIRRSCI